jgi:hypothetical protein
MAATACILFVVAYRATAAGLGWLRLDEGRAPSASGDTALQGSCIHRYPSSQRLRQLWRPGCAIPEHIRHSIAVIRDTPSASRLVIHHTAACSLLVSRELRFGNILHVFSTYTSPSIRTHESREGKPGSANNCASDISCNFVCVLCSVYEDHVGFVLFFKIDFPQTCLYTSNYGLKTESVRLAPCMSTAHKCCMDTPVWGRMYGPSLGPAYIARA